MITNVTGQIVFCFLRFCLHMTALSTLFLCILLGAILHIRYRRIQNASKFAPTECLYSRVIDITDSKAPSWIRSWIHYQSSRLSSSSCNVMSVKRLLNRFHIDELSDPVSKSSSAGVFFGAWDSLERNEVVLRVSLTQDDSKVMRYTYPSTWNAVHGPVLFVEDFARGHLRRIGKENVVIARIASFLLCEVSYEQTPSAANYYHIQVFEKAVGGDLQDWISTRITAECFRLKDSLRIWVLIAELVLNLHEINVIHADLRLANVLVHDSHPCGQLKSGIFSLTDLSRSVWLSDNMTLVSLWIYEKGTESVLEFAPEAREKHYERSSLSRHHQLLSNKVDVYSLGILLRKLMRFDAALEHSDIVAFSVAIDQAERMSSESPSNRPELMSVIATVHSLYV